MTSDVQSAAHRRSSDAISTHACPQPQSDVIRCNRRSSDAISTHACPQPQVDAGGLDLVREVSQRLVKLLLRARHQRSSEIIIS